MVLEVVGEEYQVDAGRGVARRCKARCDNSGPMAVLVVAAPMLGTKSVRAWKNGEFGLPAWRFSFV